MVLKPLSNDAFTLYVASSVRTSVVYVVLFSCKSPSLLLYQLYVASSIPDAESITEAPQSMVWALAVNSPITSMDMLFEQPPDVAV